MAGTDLQPRATVAEIDRDDLNTVRRDLSETASGGYLRRALRWFRLEECILFAQLATFVTVYAIIEGGPGLQNLWAGFSYNFHGRGTFWMFLLWCAIGTGILLLVAAIPLAGGGRFRQLMQGVWGDAQGGRARTWATVRWGVGGARAYAPFLACMGTYEMLKRLVPAIRGDTLYDMQLANFEFAVFGDLSAAMMRKAMHATWITDLLHALPFGIDQLWIHEQAYISYVYSAPALAMALWFLGRRHHFNRFMGALALCGALAYVGYVIVPVVGPKYVFQERWLEASTQALSFMDSVKGYNRDCFPSLHTAWTTLVLLGAWRGLRPFFWVYLPVGIAVYIATLYGGYHYVPDLAAGFVLAFFCWWAAVPLRRLWDRISGRNDAAWPVSGAN